MNKVAKNAILVILSSVLAQLLTFFIQSIVGKRLNAAALGEISTVQAIMTYFTLFVAFGLQTYGTREVAKEKNKTSKIVGEILSFRFILFVLSLIVIVIMSLIVWRIIGDNVLAMLLVLYGATLMPAALSIDWVYSGIQKMEYNSIYNILKSVIPFILVYIFLRKSTELYFIPVFTLIALTIGFAFQILIYFFKEKFTIKLRINKTIVTSYVVFGAPFVVSGILAMINGNVDRIVISFSRGRTEAGIYAAGYNIIYFIINIVGMIFIPIFPVMITYISENAKDKLQELMNKTSKLLAAFIIPVAIGGIILSKQIINLLYDKDFLSANISFSILLVYSVLLFFRELYGYGLNAANLEKKYVKAVFVSAIINLVLNLILTPKYGMNMAAVITLLSEIVNFVMMKYYAREIIKVKNYKNIIKVLIPSILMAALTFGLKYFNINILINIVASMAIYSILIFITKYITITEIKSLIRKG